MSDDLIKRADAIEALGEEPYVWTDDDEFAQGERSQWIDDVSAIKAVPSADRPQGEWIRTFDGNEWYWYCSNCKEQWYEEDLWMGGNEFPHYCPNCGAKMRII